MASGIFRLNRFCPFVSSSAFQIGHREEENATFNPVVNGDWHDVMSKTNHEQQNVYRMYPTKPWPETLRGGRYKPELPLPDWLARTARQG